MLMYCVCCAGVVWLELSEVLNIFKKCALGIFEFFFQSLASDTLLYFDHLPVNMCRWKDSLARWKEWGERKDVNNKY